MAGVTLSSAVRTNLLSLQNISAGQSSVQNRLATGKKVNSALDNATSFFTASSFQSRANSLSSLLDSVATGVQTLQAANNGITSITSLVSQLRSTAQQALQSTSAYSSQAKITSSAISGATSADLRGTSSATVGSSTAANSLSALQAGTKGSTTATSSLAGSLSNYAAAKATSTADFSSLTSRQAAAATAGTALATNVGNLVNGNQITITDGSGAATTAEYDSASSSDGSDGKFKDIGTLVTALNRSGTTNFTASNDGGKLKITSASTAKTFTASGTAIANNKIDIATSLQSATGGSRIKISDGAQNVDLVFDSTGASSGSFSSLSDLNTKMTNANVDVTATLGGGGGTKLVLTGTSTSTNITVDNGAGGAVLGFATSAYNATAASILTISDGATSRSYTYDTLAAAGDANKFSSIGDLNTKLGAAGVKATATAASGTGFLKLSATDYTTNLTVGGTAQASLGLGTTANSTAGSVLTINDGAGPTKSYTYDTAATSSDGTSFASISDLNTKLGTDNVKAAASEEGGKLKLTASTNTTTLAIGGTAQSGLGLLSSIAPQTAAGPLDGKSLSFTTSGGKTTTVKFGDPAAVPGAVKSLDDLNAKLADGGLSASLDSSGSLSFTTTAQTSSQSFVIGGDATAGPSTKFTSTSSSAAVRGGSGADTRDSLVTQFNNLLTQIDTAAKDANFNGLNLLNGDTLSLIFNETNTSKLDVNGTSATATGLGLSTIGASNFNDGTGINDVLSKIDKAKNTLATQASKFGSNLAVVQTRQDFTKSMINTLNVGADNLVNADMNEEATNLLSLNTSQSLAQQALSLANQSQQSVLQLIR